MNLEIKRQWLAALRSGEYKQATGALRKDDCFCVFGVLCDIYSKKNNEPWKKTNTTCTPGTHEIDGTTDCVPDQVYKWAGIQVVFGVSDAFIDLPKVNTIINLNDNDNKTFPEIADYIEANL